MRLSTQGECLEAYSHARPLERAKCGYILPPTGQQSCRPITVRLNPMLVICRPRAPHPSALAWLRRLDRLGRRGYSLQPGHRCPIGPDAHPSALSPEAKVELGRSVDALHEDFYRFFHRGPDMTIYASNLVFKVVSLGSPLQLSGLCAYKAFLMGFRRLTTAYYHETSIQLLPSPVPSHTLLSDKGILCIHWKVHLRRKRLLHRLFPESWFLWLKYMNSYAHGDFTTFLHQYERFGQREALQWNETYIQGLSYFAFNHSGKISMHAVDQLVPPPPKYWRWLTWPWNRLVREPAAVTLSQHRHQESSSGTCGSPGSTADWHRMIEHLQRKLSVSHASALVLALPFSLPRFLCKK